MKASLIFNKCDGVWGGGGVKGTAASKATCAYTLPRVEKKQTNKQTNEQKTRKKVNGIIKSEW
jgi:hypothetical protein